VVVGLYPLHPDQSRIIIDRSNICDMIGRRSSRPSSRGITDACLGTRARTGAGAGSRRGSRRHAFGWCDRKKLDRSSTGEASCSKPKRLAEAPNSRVQLDLDVATTLVGTRHAVHVLVLRESRSCDRSSESRPCS
jgi:hypothetical protein